MIKTLATYGGADPMPVLLGNEKKGWLGMFGMDRLTWNKNGELEVLPLSWKNYNPRQVGFQGFVGETFVLGSAQPGDCIWIGELDGATIQTADKSSGGPESRYSASAQGVNGEMFVVTFVDPSKLPVPTREPRRIYDLAYREPGKPWYCTRVSYPSEYGITDVAMAYRNVCCVFLPNGNFGIYSESDSSGQVVFMEVQVVYDGDHPTLVVLSHNEKWLDRDHSTPPNPKNPLAPCAEWAQLTVVPDYFLPRIIVACQQFEDIIRTGSYGQTTIYGKWIFTEHRQVPLGQPPIPPKHLGMTTDWCLHKPEQKIFVIPKPDGSLYVGYPWNDMSNPEQVRGWKFATLMDGVFTTSKDVLPHGDLMAHGADGAGVFFPRDGTYVKRFIQVLPE